MAGKKDAAPKKRPDLKDLESRLAFKTKLIADHLNPEEFQAVEALASDYMAFLASAKTERATVREMAVRLKGAGLDDLSSAEAGRAGGYLIRQGKILGAFRPGKQSPKKGFNLIVAHGDSPRLDLKPKCVFEDQGLGFLKTNLYGGLKKYHWLARPLALWGFCVLKDGRTLDFNFGEDPSEPVLTVTDLLPHLGRAQREKKLSDAFPAEKLNLLAAGRPLGSEEDKNRFKLALLQLLNQRWGLVEEDLISSELEVTPAGPPRTVGLDGSFIGGYGQDDRLAAYAALRAFLEAEEPARPLLLIIYDREEIGSYGSTGASGRFVEELAAAAFRHQQLPPAWAEVQEALLKSRALSADVEGAFDPAHADVFESLNSAHLGHGPCLVRYTGGAGKYGASEAGAEYMGLIRRILGENNICWQSTLLGRQEEGGGGTVALYLAAYGLDIVDFGPPLLSMHSPFEVCAKTDLYMTAKAYRAFYQSR